MACFVIANPAPLEEEEGHVQRSLHLHQAILIASPLSLSALYLSISLSLCCTLPVTVTDKPGGMP